MGPRPSADAPRILYVRTEGRSAPPREELRRREVAGLASRRVLVEEAFGFDLLGESDIQAMAGLRGAVFRRLPNFVALALETNRRRKDYDVVVTWSERYAIGVAGVLALRRTRPGHIAILDWVSKPVVRVPLRIVRRGVDRMMTWSSVQADFAIEHLKFDANEIIHVSHPVDEVFFAPVDVDREIIFSAGETQRDFPTLIEAVGGLEVPTVIAATRVGVLTGLRTTFTDAREQPELPPSVTIKGMDPCELRQSYAAARVVVVPLVPADNNAGLSVVLEAMSMGRPVVVSRTIGQVDIVREGETGVYVPPGDPDALREAIVELINDPERAEAMGSRAREYILERHRAEVFAAGVRQAACNFAREIGRIDSRQASDYGTVG